MAAEAQSTRCHAKDSEGRGFLTQGQQQWHSITEAGRERVRGRVTSTPEGSMTMLDKGFKVGDWLNTSGKVVAIDKGHVTLRIGGCDIRLLNGEVWNPKERGTPEGEKGT